MKNLTKIALFLTSILLCQLAYSQTQSKLKVKIEPGAKVYKVSKVEDCPDTITKGSEISAEYTKTNKKVTYTITRKTVAQKDTAILVEKEIKIPMFPYSDGWANVRPDSKDSSILHINYWLNPKNQVAAGTDIETTIRVLLCDTTYKETVKKSKLTKNTTYYLCKVEPKDYLTTSAKTWFKSTDSIIKVLDNAGNALYYLVDRYDRDTDYQLEMKNRQFISYAQKSIEYGPIVIPVKYRFSRTKNNIKVKDEFSADLNLGIYGGYRFGQYKVRYQSGEAIKEIPSVALSVGGFINIGTATIDSTSTTIGRVPLVKDDKSTIGVFSPGGGVMLSLYNLQVGLYAGIDFGFGNSAKNWNYNNRPWLGFGLAYNLNGFWKSK